MNYNINLNLFLIISLNRYISYIYWILKLLYNYIYSIDLYRLILKVYGDI